MIPSSSRCLRQELAFPLNLPLEKVASAISEAERINRMSTTNPVDAPFAQFTGSSSTHSAKKLQSKIDSENIEDETQIR
jgi:hypothetical protein